MRRVEKEAVMDGRMALLEREAADAEERYEGSIVWLRTAFTEIDGALTR